jgi:hypothetical protein
MLKERKEMVSLKLNAAFDLISSIWNEQRKQREWEQSVSDSVDRWLTNDNSYQL